MEDELRARIESILGADRWVTDVNYPAVAPRSGEEVSKLLKGHPGIIMVVGSGSSFSSDFRPGNDILILLTNLIRTEFSLSEADQTLDASVGWSISQVNSKLDEAGFIIPALLRFENGTVGGRLAEVSSCPTLDGVDGWIQALLALEVVLPSGEMIEFGSHCIKDVAGYDLKHFFTGSRGTVGVIIKAVFRCKPLDNNKKTAELIDHVATGGYDPRWKNVFDPFGRMQPGV